MNWKPELDELARREAFARAMGGVDKVKRQRDQGRLTVRERIDKLLDGESLSLGDDVIEIDKDRFDFAGGGRGHRDFQFSWLRQRRHPRLRRRGCQPASEACRRGLKPR